MPHPSTEPVRRWLKRVVSTALLCGGCIAGLGFLYGGNAGSSAAIVEASHLTDVETSELIGTSTYQDQIGAHSAQSVDGSRADIFATVYPANLDAGKANCPSPPRQNRRTQADKRTC